MTVFAETSFFYEFAEKTERMGGEKVSKTVKHNLLVEEFYVDVCLPLWQKKPQPCEFFIMSCCIAFRENTFVSLALTQILPLNVEILQQHSLYRCSRHIYIVTCRGYT